jgi:thiol-disulfide isomerase/thioredoxin
MKTPLFALVLALALPLSLPAAEKPAPPFLVKDLGGKTWTQKGAGSGVTLVDFWASWCAPCLKEIPALNTLAAQHKGKLAVLGLGLDQGGAPVVKAAAKKHGIQYPVAAADPKLAEAYAVQGFPSAFVVKDGKILATLTGERTLAAFERDLAPWLK